jgi:hypothetical protein
MWSETARRSGPQWGQVVSRQLSRQQSADRGAAPLSGELHRHEGQRDGRRTKVDPRRQLGGIGTLHRAVQANGSQTGLPFNQQVPGGDHPQAECRTLNTNLVHGRHPLWPGMVGEW